MSDPEVVGTDFTIWVDPATSRRWHVEVTWADFDGRAEPISLALRSATGANIGDPVGPLPTAPRRERVLPITATAIREIGFRSLLDELRQKTVDRMLSRAGLDDHALEAERWTPRRGAAVPASEAERAAALYKRAVRAGLDPIPEIKRELGVSAATAKRRVKAAETRGLLPKAEPGRVRKV